MSCKACTRRKRPSSASSCLLFMCLRKRARLAGHDIASVLLPANGSCNNFLKVAGNPYMSMLNLSLHAMWRSVHRHWTGHDMAAQRSCKCNGLEGISAAHEMLHGRACTSRCSTMRSCALQNMMHMPQLKVQSLQGLRQVKHASMLPSVHRAMHRNLHCKHEHFTSTQFEQATCKRVPARNGGLQQQG